MNSFAQNKVSCIAANFYSLFLGLLDGDILEWIEPGIINRIFQGHTKCINLIGVNEEHLWSADNSNVMKLWNISTGLCTDSIDTGEDCRLVLCLVPWRGY